MAAAFDYRVFHEHFDPKQYRKKGLFYMNVLEESLGGLDCILFGFDAVQTGKEFDRENYVLTLTYKYAGGFVKNTADLMNLTRKTIVMVESGRGDSLINRLTQYYDKCYYTPVLDIVPAQKLIPEITCVALMPITRQNLLPSEYRNILEQLFSKNNINPGCLTQT